MRKQDAARWEDCAYRPQEVVSGFKYVVRKEINGIPDQILCICPSMNEAIFIANALNGYKQAR